TSLLDFPRRCRWHIRVTIDGRDLRAQSTTLEARHVSMSSHAVFVCAVTRRCRPPDLPGALCLTGAAPWAERTQHKGNPMKLDINGSIKDVDAPPEMPLLWVLRDLLGFTGTKFGCGMAQCGACTVHLDGQPVRACITPVSTVGNRKVRTIEGLSADGSHPVQRAWAEADVVQCGYCQSGQIMTTVALLEQKPDPSDADI